MTFFFFVGRCFGGIFGGSFFSELLTVCLVENAPVYWDFWVAIYEILAKFSFLNAKTNRFKSIEKLHRFFDP
jgi:hypothetical protein